MPTIYTVSCASEGAREAIERFIPPLSLQRAAGNEPCAFLFDIRQSIHHAELPFWRKERLALHFGDWYQYLQSLRNAHEADPARPVKLRDLEVGFSASRAALQKKDIILLCWCPVWRPCHRLEVSEALASLLLPTYADLCVEHLLDPPHAVRAARKCLTG